MAERREAEDEFNPRHRIVGAVILVALAVIFLPMVLNDRPPETSATRLAELPAPDTRVVVAPVPAPGVAPRVAGDPEAAERPPVAATRTVTVPVEPAPVTSVRPVAPAPAPAPPTGVKPATDTPADSGAPSAKKPPAAERTATASRGWIVQVGVFSQVDNARRLQERLKAGGYEAVLHPPTAEKGKTVRVEVGPYSDPSLAKSAAARIQREFGIKGIVRSQ